MPPRFVAAIAATTAALGAAAAQPFQELEARLAEHPALAALTFEADAARARSEAATALPDPVLSFGVNNLPINDPALDRFLPTNTAIGVRQDFPNLAGRRARAAQAGAAAEVSGAVRAARLAALRAELVSLLLEKERIAKKRALAEQRSEKYDRLADVVDTEISGGRPAVFRLAEIEAERAEVARTLAELDGADGEADARLVDLLGFVPEAPAPEITERPFPDDPRALHGVRIAEAEISRAQGGVAEAQAAFRPHWGAQLTYQQRQEGSGAPGEVFPGDDWVSGMVTMTVPIWSGRSQKPGLAAAKAEAAAAEAGYLAAARRARAQHASLRSRKESAEAVIGVLKAKIAAVQEEIDAQLRLYESGAGDYAPIIDGEIAILTLRAAIADEGARAAEATARMNSLLVTP